MRHLGPTVTAALAVLLSVTTAPANAAVRDLQPEQLPRGADASVPHVEGNTIVDGDRRIPVEGTNLVLRAVTRTGYIVATQVTRYDNGGRLLKVRRNGSATVLVRSGASEVAVNDAGTHLALGSLVSDGETVLVVRRISDGETVARRFVGYPGGFTDVVDFDGTRLLLSRSRSGQTLVWNWATDQLRTVAAEHRWLHEGNLEADVFAAFRSGSERCMVVARISRPDQVLWKTCGERVIALSDDGRRMVTATRDPSYQRITAVTVRTIHGRVLGSYTSREFTGIQWESPRRVIFSVAGETHASTVRCTPKRCKNASDPLPVEP